jgi:site-specific DNA-methyltransferase (adenine-specific)
MSTDPGDVVLDPFLGTGTTAIAAKALGRHFVGVELDPEYVRIAKTKLAQVQPSMHEGLYVSKYLGKIQSIRDIDAAKIFPPQLSSVEKKRLRAENGNGYDIKIQPKLLEKPAQYVTRAKNGRKHMAKVP